VGGTHAATPNDAHDQAKPLIAWRPPEPCAQVRILPRALPNMGRELGQHPGHGPSTFSPSLTAAGPDSPLFAGAPRGEGDGVHYLPGGSNEASVRDDTSALSRVDAIT
jgi:hypothetical protein